jgi:hypothetical protein
MERERERERETARRFQVSLPFSDICAPAGDFQATWPPQSAWYNSVTQW